MLSDGILSVWIGVCCLVLFCRLVSCGLISVHSSVGNGYGCSSGSCVFGIVFVRLNFGAKISVLLNLNILSHFSEIFKSSQTHFTKIAMLHFKPPPSICQFRFAFFVFSFAS